MKWIQANQDLHPGLYSVTLSEKELEKYTVNGVLKVPFTNPKNTVKQYATKPRDKNKTDQEVGTDPALFSALHNHFGFTVDLACTAANALCVRSITKEDDSLSVKWSKLGGPLWLNPPFNKIEPWAKKCYLESLDGAKIVMLTPASVGSRWYRKYCYKKSWTRFLSGKGYRLKFVGHKHNYPKDLMISIFDGLNFGIDIWPWREGWDR